MFLDCLDLNISNTQLFCSSGAADFTLMIHLFNKTEYSPFLQLSELNTQLSQTNQLKYAASAQPTQKSTAFTQLIRRSEKKRSISTALTQV